MWNTNKIIPDKTKKVVVIKSNGDSFIGTCEVSDGIYTANIYSSIKQTSFWKYIKMWAYLDDLLPKK